MFSNKSAYSRHLPCRFKVNEDQLRKQRIEPVILTPPRERDNVLQILQQMSTIDAIKLCISQRWALRGFWPLVFRPARKGSRQGSIILNDYTADSHSKSLLCQYLQVERTLTIPVTAIITDVDRDIQAYISPELLHPKPATMFTVTPGSQTLTVTLNTGVGGGGDGGGGDDSDESDDYSSDNEDGDYDSEYSNENSSEDSSDDVITYALTQGPNPNNTFNNIQHLLPASFQPGLDGQGLIDGHRRQITCFRSPWQFSSVEFERLCHLSKIQYFKFVADVQNAVTRVVQMNIFAKCLLVLMKLAKNHSFQELSVFFSITDASRGRNASDIFYKILMFYYMNCVNLPAIIDNQGNINQREVDKLLDTAYLHMSQFYRTLVEDFQDPSGQNRIPVILQSDATYLDVTTSSDIEYQKYAFYMPRAGHTTKCVSVCSCLGKFLNVFPLCSSQSPSSGDAYLTATYARLSNVLTAILRGNHRFFVIFVVDSGYVIESRTRPLAVANIPNVVQICQNNHCVLLHTSDKHNTYHLQRNSAGKIVKIPRDNTLESLSENVVRFTRIMRKVMEQAHAGLKQMLKFTNAKKLMNTYLRPFTARQRRKYGLDDSFRNISKLSFIIVVCLSLYNTYHPGFGLSFMSDQEQVFAANQFVRRLFLENPLLYRDLWPVNFVGRDRQWTEILVTDLPLRNNLGFPQLQPDQINPVAVELCGGTHALNTCDSSITYIHQKELEGLGLTIEEIQNRLHHFPPNMKIEFCDINSEPPNWDHNKFGDWQNVTLVRCAVPPSNKSAVRQNYHWPVIAFGIQPSDRLGLRDPYRTILFWYCHNCASLNGSLSFCRHLAVLLKTMSFRNVFKSTARGIDLLNTVVEDSRQALRILPPVDVSTNLPVNVRRRSENKRPGRLNPVYNIQAVATAPPPTVMMTAGQPSTAALPSTAILSTAAPLTITAGQPSALASTAALPAPVIPSTAATMAPPQTLTLSAHQSSASITSAPALPPHVTTTDTTSATSTAAIVSVAPIQISTTQSTTITQVAITVTNTTPGQTTQSLTTSTSINITPVPSSSSSGGASQQPLSRLGNKQIIN